MSLNNYSEDYVRDNPRLLINFLINQAKEEPYTKLADKDVKYIQGVFIL